MAEPDNFEEDLFADLYTEDEAPQNHDVEETQTVTKPEVAASPEVKSLPNANGALSGVSFEAMFKNRQVVDGDLEYHLGGGDGGVGVGSGSGGDNSYDSPMPNEAHGPGIKEDGKMFIGGLNWETTDQSLKEYFSQFGEVVECMVMRDGVSGRSRGFGFLTFKDARTVNIVMVKEHYLDGKIIDPKRAIPRDEQERTSKIFVGGVSQEATEQDFKEYFMQFGRIVDATLMIDKDTGRPRGFGFVTFDSEAAVDACLSVPLEILGKPIEVKKAQPRGNMKDEEENRNGRAGRFRKAEETQSPSQLPQASNNQMAQSGMTPQLVAQYWQRMQQYMAMMQQSMAMGSGRGMPVMPGMLNPAMMMQMQAMQQMQNQGNRSQSPQSPSTAMANMSGMNPAMMQQMQAMQQMQMQNMGGGASGFTASTASNSAGRVGTPGYSAFEQQVFEQQKYEQQQQIRRGQRDQYSGQGAYSNGMGVGPTSWEGMYDDVPQPNIPAAPSGGGRGNIQGGSVRSTGRTSVPPPTGPGSAPPANAPTGPKNAGKPGANYRGGGRGGNRGFHPYAR
ncbi:Polyadenylate-binding protein, cytoplasmic and nuclear [Golovinomyces cichoracearum]|uniref:Polyadenylate-binding protein, cytoplasmic and nuclear n=1 Tax=Golovinomyces cichoracearum TaxID=62708 RepID=A0A420HJX6_9PEZI|nr:Polyadenylate-binding protein, cytoplasmic and nuclear [Golovinomyces cichoracearum]